MKPHKFSHKDKARLQGAFDLHQQGKLAEAAAEYKKLLRIFPAHPVLLTNLGMVALAQRNLVDGINFLGTSLKIDPRQPQALANRALALYEQGRLDEALADCDRAIALAPDYPEAHNNRGLIMQKLGDLSAAVQCYDRAIAINPGFAQAYLNRGHAMKDLARLNEALANFDQAIRLFPNYAEAHGNRGNVLKKLYRSQEALASFDRAIAINPGFADAHRNKGNLLTNLKQFQAAIACYELAMALRPGYGFLAGLILGNRRGLCDWRDGKVDTATLTGMLLGLPKAAPPFPYLGMTDSLCLQRQLAEAWMREVAPPQASLGPIAKHLKKDKIRIGYYSADFHRHATTVLMAELFERHDHDQFELIGFTFGPDLQDDMRQRVVAAFDRFIDVRDQSDEAVARLSRDLEIDIAVDLKGYTRDARAAIFSYRAAPIQVNYLGYPGTMGAEYIDYLIADKILIPEQSQPYYSEKIVYLPDSYQVNDRKRLIADRIFTRTELGLPDTGFVFCCFNNNYKITPETFDGWMRILGRVAGSVLWLLEDNPTAANNLRKEAALRHIDPDRLIFAARVPPAEHLARHRAADLFLDTLPCNAHTTTSDALWAGLPVLTCMGESFASRVAASLLYAIGLPELVTTTQKEYEDLAVALASEPERLALLKQRLAANRLTMPLFDTPLFTRHIEAAYTAMYDRYLEDLPPAVIHIDA